MEMPFLNKADMVFHLHSGHSLFFVLGAALPGAGFPKFAIILKVFQGRTCIFFSFSIFLRHFITLMFSARDGSDNATKMFYAICRV